MTQAKPNITVNQGVPMEIFFLQVRILKISLTTLKPLSLKFAVSEGSNTLDVTKEESRWSEKFCDLKKSVLNFQAPERPTNKHPYLLKIVKAKDLEEIATFDIKIKSLVTQFVFQGNKKFERLEQSGNGCAIQYVVFIQKSRVLLLNQILKQGGASAEELNIPEIAKVKYKSLDDSQQKQNNQKKTTNQDRFQALNQMIDENKNIITKATLKYTKLALPPLQLNKPQITPKMGEQIIISKAPQLELSPKQIQSPLMKIVKGKLQTKSVHDNLRRAQSLKHVSSQKLLIKRTDSIDEDEEVYKKKTFKRFLIAILIFIVAYFLLFVKRKPSKQLKPTKPIKPGPSKPQPNKKDKRKV